MLVTLYKSKLCPRCRLAGKYLREISASNPEIEVREVDILSAPRQSWKDGIRMIPALKIGKDILSALLLSKKNITDFIADHKP